MRTSFLVLGVLAAGLLVACEQEEEPTPSGTTGSSDRVTAPAEGTETVGETVDETAEQVEETAENIGEQADEMQAKAVAEAEDRLTQIEARLEELGTRLDAAAEPIKTTVTPLLERAREQYDAVEAKVAELRNADSSTWESLSADLQTSLDSLEQMVSDIASRIGG